jgi:hypothetical protein
MTLPRLRPMPRPYPACTSALMNYSLFASTGNLIDSFDDEVEARAALQRIVELEPESADETALFVSDDEGTVVEGPIHAVPASVR